MPLTESAAAPPAQWNHHRLLWRLGVGLFLAVCLVALIGVASHRSTVRLSATAQSVAHTHEVQENLLAVLSGANDLQRASRGFVITADERFTRAYAEAFSFLEERISTLKRLVSDNRDQALRVPALEESLQEARAEFDRVIAVRRESGFEAARDRVSSFGGESLLDAVKDTVDAMLAAETALLELRQSVAADSAADARRIIFWGTFATFLLLALCAVILLRDIEARRRAEAALLETSALQRAILDAATSSIISTSSDGIIHTFNSAAERMLGYAAHELIGKQTPAVLHDPEEVRKRSEQLSRELGRNVGPGFETFVARARLGEPDEHEWTYVRKDGSRFPVLLSVSALKTASGEITGFLGVGQDITERKKVADALARARDAAIESARLKAEFLANMSHEIRTPMNGIIGMGQLLLETGLTPKQRDFTRTICSSADSLLTVINDILDFSKIESGKLEIESIDFDLKESVGSVLDLLASRAAEKELELAALIHPDVPVALHGDTSRLRQALLNLAGNAIKFTAAGEVALEVIKLRESNGEILLRFEVRDTGIGMTEETLGRVFKPFQQADGSTSRKYGGTGLGLAISRQLVELMGGRIGATSQPGRGSIFWFELPFTPAKNLSRAMPDTAASLAGLHALIVDDNATNRVILTHQLAAFGMTSQALSSPQEALALLRAPAGPVFALIVLDYQMPEMDGLALARAIQAIPRQAATPKIILTSLGSQLPDPELAAGGIRACLHKPIRESRLFEAIAPIFAAQAAVLTPALPTPEPELPNFDGLSVLLAEDNVVNQRITMAQLAEANVQLHAVANGREAVEALHSRPFDIILMDCQMPELDGYEATRQIRGLESRKVFGPQRQRVRIIALTAHAMAGDRQKCLEAGMDDYVPKPVAKGELVAALKRGVQAIRAASVPQSPSPEPQPTLDGHVVINHARIADIGGVDSPDFTVVVQYYLEQANAELPQLAEFSASQNLDNVKRLAHKLAGASLACGFDRLGQLLRSIEQRAIVGNAIEVKALSLRIAPEFQALRQALDGLAKGVAEHERTEK